MSIDRVRKVVAVAGATGRFAVVVDVLLARGHSVRALTRRTESPAAARLRAAGAEVVYGDFDDADSLRRAAAGADALFATGTTHRAGLDGELRHGHNLARAAALAGVAHLVFSSGEGAAPDSPLPLFRVKHEVEQAIRALPIAHTILAPVYFMENLFNPWNLPALRGHRFPSPIPIDIPLQQAAIADVAKLAVLAIERPPAFAGQRIAIASDSLTGEQASRALSRVLDRGFHAEQLPRGQLVPGVRALFDWLERTGRQVNLDSLHARYPEVGWLGYEAWLRSQRRRLRELCPHEPATVA